MRYNNAPEGLRRAFPPTRTRLSNTTHGSLLPSFPHGAHQVLTWNVSNAVVMIDPAHGRKIAKDKSIDRVDGLVALAMAIGLYNREPAPMEYDFDRPLVLSV